MKTRPKRALLAVGALATVVGLALAVTGLMGLGCELVVQLDPALVDAGEPDALYADEDEYEDAGSDAGAEAAPRETGAESAAGDSSADAPADSVSDSPGDDGGGGDGNTTDASGADSASE